MEKLKLLVLILVAITVVSCSSTNEPEVGDDIVIENPTEDPGENPTDDPAEDPNEIIEAYKELDQAFLLFYSRKYDEALVEMQRLVEKYKNIEVGRMALVNIERIFEQTGRDSEILSMLEEYSQGNSKVAQFAHYRKGYQYIRLGEYHKAIEIMKGTEFSEEDAHLRQARLYDLGWIYHDLLGDKEEAYKYFIELIDTYPDCPLAEVARVVYRPR
jgi:tetratricopeptide (TPR) repeat protein